MILHAKEAYQLVYRANLKLNKRLDFIYKEINESAKIGHVLIERDLREDEVLSLKENGYFVRQLRRGIDVQKEGYHKYEICWNYDSESELKSEYIPIIRPH